MVDYNTGLCLGPLMWEQNCLAFVERLLGNVKHLSRCPMHQGQKNHGVRLRLGFSKRGKLKRSHVLRPKQNKRLES